MTEDEVMLKFMQEIDRLLNANLELLNPNNNQIVLNFAACACLAIVSEFYQLSRLFDTNLQVEDFIGNFTKYLHHSLTTQEENT